MAVSASAAPPTRRCEKRPSPPGGSATRTQFGLAASPLFPRRRQNLGLPGRFRLRARRPQRQGTQLHARPRILPPPSAPRRFRTARLPPRLARPRTSPGQTPRRLPSVHRKGRWRTPGGSQSQFRPTPIGSTNNWVRSFSLPHPEPAGPETVPPALAPHPAPVPEIPKPQVLEPSADYTDDLGNPSQAPRRRGNQLLMKSSRTG